MTTSPHRASVSVGAAAGRRFHCYGNKGVAPPHAPTSIDFNFAARGLQPSRSLRLESLVRSVPRPPEIT